MKRERCGGTVAYEVIGGMRVFTAVLGGSNLYNAKCTVCGHQWQNAGKAKVCRALVVSPGPVPVPPLPDPPYGLVHIHRELHLTTQVDGLEVVMDDSRDMGRLDTSSLVVISRERLATLEKAMEWLCGLADADVAYGLDLEGLNLMDGVSLAEVTHTGAVYPPGRHPRLRGTTGYPCEDCRQEGEGATLLDGWYRCNACGYPGK